MEVADDADQLGFQEAQTIKIAAQKMQNLTGRKKQTWLRANATAWGVQRLHRRQGKFTEKLSQQLEQEISAKIRAAFSMWLARSSQSTKESSSNGN